MFTATCNCCSFRNCSSFHNCSFPSSTIQGKRGVLASSMIDRRISTAGLLVEAEIPRGVAKGALLKEFMVLLSFERGDRPWLSRAMSRYAKCGFVLRLISSSVSFDSIASGWDGEEKSGLGFILAQTEKIKERRIK